MVVPLVDLKAQYRSLKGEIDIAISRVLSRASFVHGEEVALFEREFAEYCDVREAVGVASGSDALRLALLACEVGPGHEVITTPVTFAATLEAISQVGATPVFADVDPETSNLDPEMMRSAITERTSAVLSTHLFGNPADMDSICDIAEAHGLRVIEDATQAHGARYRGKSVGTIGDVGCFSFYPTNNLGAFGDAGIVVTDDLQIADKVRLLRDHGRRENNHEHLCLGFNSRMDTLQAAVLRVKLPLLEKWNAHRRVIASVYRQRLQDLDLVLPPDGPHLEPSYQSFVIRTPHRGHLRRALTSVGIHTEISFYVPLHLQPACSHLGCQMGDFPNSERFVKEALSLPMSAHLSLDQVHHVCRAISKAFIQVAIVSGSPSSEMRAIVELEPDYVER